MTAKRRNSFYIQGSILAAASIVSRLIGLAFRIPIARMLGDAGLGAYSNAYEIYSLALLLSTFSIPMAVSKLVAARETRKEYANSFRVMKVSFVFSCLLGLIMASLIWFFGDEIATFLIKSPNSAMPLKALAPTIFIFAMISVFRGFFQGKNTVIPTSISQILEQIVHVVFGIAFASLFLKIFADRDNSFSYGAAGATLGTLAGAITALIFLAFVYFIYRPKLMSRIERDEDQNSESYTFLLKMLLVTMLPIVMNQFLYSVTGNIDSVLLNNILALKGVDEDTRLVLYSRYSGKFKLITNVPLAIASAIGVAIIPNLVHAYTAGDREKLELKIAQAVKLNMMIAIPCAFGIMALASPILAIFGDDSQMSVNLMHIGAMSVVFYGYSTTTNSIMQGTDRMRYPVFHALLGVIIYCIFDFCLLYFTDLGVYTLALGYMVFPFTVGILNFLRIRHDLEYRQEALKTFLLPIVFSLVMAFICYFSFEGMLVICKNTYVSLAVAIMFGAFTYGTLMILTHTITREEILEFPMGGRIVGIIEKTGYRL